MSDWKTIVQINDDSLRFVSKILDSYIGTKFDPLFIQFYTLNINRRLVFIQKGISPHLTEIEIKPQLELPIGILLRSACLDILQYGYIIKCLDDVKIGNPPQPDVIPDYSSFNSELKKVFSGNIKNQIDDYKALKDVGMLSDAEFIEKERKFQEDFIWLYNNNDIEQSCPTRKIFRILKNDSKYDVFSNIFEDYSYYSKLEHFGILSWIFTIPEKENIPLILHRIKRNLMTILHIYNISFVYLQRNDNDIAVLEEWSNQLSNLNEYK